MCTEKAEDGEGLGLRKEKEEEEGGDKQEGSISQQEGAIYHGGHYSKPKRLPIYRYKLITRPTILLQQKSLGFFPPSFLLL